MVELVKSLMNVRKVSQIEIARHTGVSKTAISRFLNDSADIRSDALVKVLKYLGADVQQIIQNKITLGLGVQGNTAVSDDIYYLIQKAQPIQRKMMTETLISIFSNEKNPEIKSRVSNLKKFKNSIKTVRRLS